MAFNAQIAGLPTKTASAPKAIALNTSEPLLIPPSRKTGILLLTTLAIYF